MTQRFWKESDRFEAVAENGEKTMIIEETQWLCCRTHSGEALAPGVKRLTTINGEPVNFLENGRYQLVACGIVVERSIGY